LAAELISVHDGSLLYGQEIVLDEPVVAGIRAVLQQFAVVEPWDAEMVKQVVKGEVKKAGLKFAQLARPLRRALIGKDDGPGVFDLMKLIGRQATLERISRLLEMDKQGA